MQLSYKQLACKNTGSDLLIVIGEQFFTKDHTILILSFTNGEQNEIDFDPDTLYLVSKPLHITEAL